MKEKPLFTVPAFSRPGGPTKTDVHTVAGLASSRQVSDVSTGPRQQSVIVRCAAFGLMVERDRHFDPAPLQDLKAFYDANGWAK